MSRLSQIKCDQCGTTASPKAASAAGWQKITAMSVFEGPSGVRPTLGDFADLCSWACVGAFAAAKLGESTLWGRVKPDLLAKPMPANATLNIPETS